MLTLTLDVSSCPHNKFAYTINGYALNRSFQSVVLAPQDLHHDVIQAGKAYTAVHSKREPVMTGAAARGVTTPKHSENFVSSQLLTADDDSSSVAVIDGWLADPFFGRYGWAFVESTNSTPTAQRGHPLILFDQPITSLAIWRDCLAAFVHAYPRVDPAMKNPMATYCNKPGASVHFVSGLNNICPLRVYVHCILLPYYHHLASLEAARRPVHREIPSVSTNARHDRYVIRTVENTLQQIASAENGTRHILLRNKSKFLGHLLAADWHSLPFGDIEEQLLRAAEACSYVQDHGIGITRRTIESGLELGAQSPNPLPAALAS